MILLNWSGCRVFVKYYGFFSDVVNYYCKKELRFGFESNCVGLIELKEVEIVKYFFFSS